MPNSIKKTVINTVRSLKLFDLFNYYNEDKIITYQKWLQRLSQQRAWTSKQFKKAIEYIEHLIHGSANVQAFLLADISSLISTAEKQAKLEEGPKSEIFLEILKDLKLQEEKGVEYIILDGQNRLQYGIKPFFKNIMKLNIKTSNKVFSNVYFKDLDSDIQNEIKNTEIFVCTVKSEDISHILSTLQAINQGEAWTQHERRSVMFTPVAFEMNKLSNNYLILETCKKLSEAKVIFNNKEYALEKRGDTLLFAQFLHFLQKGNFGNDDSYDTLYNTIDASLDKNIQMLKYILQYICQTYTDNPSLVSETRSKTYFINMFIILNMLVNKNARNRGLLQYTFNIKEPGKIDQILSAKAFFSGVFDIINVLRADISQFEFERDSLGNIVIDPKTKKPKVNRALAKVGYWVYHNKGSAQIDLEARERIIAPKLNELISNLMNQGLIHKEDPRKIDTLTTDILFATTKNDILSRYGERIKSIGKLEVDHIVPVSKGGDNSLENLVITSKENNRRKAGK
jgi:5-methylcytosine-specific restriction endonuclease McrA